MTSDPTLTILVIFYNNRREAPNTLYSLSAKYQTNVESSQYNVIVIDSGSSEPLDEKVVKSFGDNFSYHSVATNHPSPTESLRYGLNLVKTPYVGVIIDGAHILSPGILNYFFEIQSFKPDSFIYTTKYHIGSYHQNDSMTLGYNQAKEDELMATVNWKENGYLLYSICNFYNSPFNEFVVSSESNCFFVPTSLLRESKIFDKPYYSLGGGFINLDLFKFFIEHQSLENYLILGEGTFHQYHGGASTNVERKLHPIKAYRAEYFNINKVPFIQPTYETFYYGKYNKTISDFRPMTKANHIKAFLDEEFETNNPEALLGSLKYAIEKFPFNIPLRIRLAAFYEAQDHFELAEKTLLDARAISRQTLQAPKHLYQLYYNFGKFDLARKYIDEALDIDTTDPILYLRRAQLAKASNNLKQFNADIIEAKKYLDKGIGENPIFHTNAVFFLMDLGKIGLAGNYLKQALPISPNHMDLLVLAINILPRTNDKALFRTIAKRILQAPKHEWPDQLFKRLGFAYQYIGDYEDSVDCYQQFVDNLDESEKEEEAYSIYNHILSLALANRMPTAKAHLQKFKQEKFSNNYQPDIKLVETIFKLQENKMDETLNDVINLMKPLFSKAVYRELVDRLLMQLNEPQTELLLTSYLNHTSGLSRNISIPHQELLQRINDKYNQFKSGGIEDYSGAEDTKFDGFIFTHIQKTAGTSIRRYFAWASKLSNIPISKVHIPGEFGTLFKTNTVQLTEQELTQLESKKVQLLLEHTSYHSTVPNYLKHLKNPFYFTILRDPWSRFVSYYYFFYFEKHPVWNKHLSELSLENLESFIRKYRNIQTAYIAGIEWHLEIDKLVTDKHLAIAKQNLVTKYHAFGLFEALEDSIKQLQVTAPKWLIIPELKIPYLNPSSKTEPQTNEEVKSLFLKLNSYDVELYNYAKELFDQKTIITKQVDLKNE